MFLLKQFWNLKSLDKKFAFTSEKFWGVFFLQQFLKKQKHQLCS